MSCSLIRPTRRAASDTSLEAPILRVQTLGSPIIISNSGYSDITAEGKGGLERDKGCCPGVGAKIDAEDFNGESRK
jgi:hypothetical protein